jgi:hypothetical protein
MSTTAPHPDAYQQFYQTALEYYVAARAALFCRCTLVPGNLFHHAVEMLLKGQLSKTIPLKDLKNPKKFGHKLPLLWATFKNLFPTEDLSEFEQMIAELEEFESIRYPDKILKQGAQIGIGWGRGFSIGNTLRNEHKYQVGMGDVDAFFGRLFPLCRINPKAYFPFLASSAEGLAAITTENAACKDWLP